MAPTHYTSNSVRYNVHLSRKHTIVKPGDKATLQTCIIANIPEGYYLQLATSSLSSSNWTIQQDIVDASHQVPIVVNIHNTSSNSITTDKGKCIKQMIYKKELILKIKLKFPSQNKCVTMIIALSKTTTKTPYI